MEYQAALDDALKSIELDSDWYKVWFIYVLFNLLSCPLYPLVNKLRAKYVNILFLWITKEVLALYLWLLQFSAGDPFQIDNTSR